MKITQIAVGSNAFTGHVLYVADTEGRLWQYTPGYVSPMGNTRSAHWSQLELPKEARAA